MVSPIGFFFTNGVMEGACGNVARTSGAMSILGHELPTRACLDMQD